MRPSLAPLLLVLSGLLLVVAPGRAFDQAHRRYARVLDRYASDGRVNYAGLKSDATDLRGYLEETSAVAAGDFEAWSRPQQLAFLLNVYNASVLQLVIEHYPVASIRKIGGLFQSPWGLRVVRLWGDVHSLDWLEHETIRPRYREPRIHFALVCAAKGCPPLRREPYLAATLEAQLDDQARAFLRQPDKNRLDAPAHTLRLSPIFKWYGEDFTAQAQSLAAYVRPYFNAADSALLADPALRVSFTPYDWSLNDARKTD